jgi:azurin
VRNLSWPADEIDLQPRPDNFGDLDQHLHYFKADIIIAAFGANESFAGEAGLPGFEQRLDKFLKHVTSQAYNGVTAAKLVMLSPTASEDVNEVAAAERNNGALKAYTEMMRDVTEDSSAAFVDVFTPTVIEFDRPGSQNTGDGHSLNQLGHAYFATAAFKELFGSGAPEVDEAVRERVVGKATQFFYRYRPLNTFYYTGGRNKSYGYLDFLPAMRNFDIMVGNRDEAIHAAAAGKPGKVDDSNVPELDGVVMARGANEWLSPADELKAFNIDPRFEVNCFASEEDFPELACPIQMRWDARGRLWVSCSTTYPHVYPGQKPVDKIVILEDTDQDGKADTCKTFADDLHIPLSFVLDGKGGVYVSEEPHLSYIADTDGDGVADHREIIFTGFGCEDSHHALHDFVWTPGGDLMFREAIFHNSQVETAYGPVRAKNSSWFLYHPSTRKLTAFGGYPNTNPWGVTFDPWGNHVASHPVFASTFHATNREYPGQHPSARGMQAYSGVCGQDFVDFDFWPEEMQGGYLKARYKPTNRIEFHRWVEKEDCFEEQYVSDVIFSTNLSFIPVDLRFGPRGAAYVCDWYNPVKGHAQYSLRDPRRDRKAGRIWRIVPKGAKLVDAPQVHGASAEELVTLLKSPHYRYRYWAKRELRTRDEGDVLPLLGALAADKKTSDLTKLEVLWMLQSLDRPDVKLLDELIRSKDHLVAASAYGALRFWYGEIPDDGIVLMLSDGVANSSQHVRREAVIAASYIGTKQALDCVLPIMDEPAGTHLSYALNTALASEKLARHWKGTQNEKRVSAAIARLATGAKMKPKTHSAVEANFDSQKGLQSVELGCVSERLLFTKEKFKVKAGKPVKLVFKNPDATQHNLVILKKGASVERVGMAGNEMAKSPEGIKKHFIPEDKSILHHTKLLAPNSVETLRFVAPTVPGEYPYVCTFPGHWVLMRGVMVVE